MNVSKLKNKLSKDLAKSWGYSNEKEAEADGYNTKPISCTVKEAMDCLKLNRDQVMTLVYKWRDEHKVTYSINADFCKSVRCRNRKPV